ncbi:hypothetical protein DY000_02032541 [Brassica cretica]|uniref:Uncharacterized protein n=1 Tax=Brassica cretica TaxID=69181 RepID=A0ABQ7DIZ9_BRACR|nr:hypothetical protein DY000_02032541 [Brassica cretica]
MPSSNGLDEANSSSGATIAFVVASLEHLSGGIEYPDRIRVVLLNPWACKSFSKSGLVPMPSIALLKIPPGSRPTGRTETKVGHSDPGVDGMGIGSVNRIQGEAGHCKVGF